MTIILIPFLLIFGLIMDNIPIADIKIPIHLNINPAAHILGPKYNPGPNP